MSEKLTGADAQSQDDHHVDPERREALIKLGKYTAYATPIVLASVSTAAGAPVSGPPTPPPTPPPVTPPPGPPVTPP